MAKPHNWNEMTDKQKTEYAKQLLNSARGSYIIGQALTVAVNYMKEAELKRREVSNIEDMEVLKTLFFCFG